MWPLECPASEFQRSEIPSDFSQERSARWACLSRAEGTYRRRVSSHPGRQQHLATLGGVSICVDFTVALKGPANVTLYCDNKLFATLLSIDSRPVGSTIVWRVPPLDRVTTFSTSSRWLDEAEVLRTDTVHTVARVST